MELIKPGVNINFVGKMRFTFIISASVTILMIAYIIARGGVNLGIDFAGGTIIQVKFASPAAIETIRDSLQHIKLENSVIQQVSGREANEYLIRTEMTSSDLKGLSDHVDEALLAAFGKGGYEIRKVEMVGPKAGKDLRQKGILAVTFAWIGMLVYITWRYEFRYALGGIIALLHDVIVTTGVLCLLGKEVTLTIIAAMLTIIGYSINDTIVVYDRIRENARKSARKELGQVINESINQTLSRTILTSLTVILVLVALFVFGGPVIHDFSFVLLVGAIVGTYSSIFIASPLVLVWEKYRPARRIRGK